MTHITLPPALDRTKHPTTEEVAFARSLSLEQRLVVLARVCRADLQILRLNAKRNRLLTERDQVPDSTVSAFQRLTSID